MSFCQQNFSGSIPCGVLTRNGVDYSEWLITQEDANALNLWCQHSNMYVEGLKTSRFSCEYTCNEHFRCPTKCFLKQMWVGIFHDEMFITASHPTIMQQGCDPWELSSLFIWLQNVDNLMLLCSIGWTLIVFFLSILCTKCMRLCAINGAIWFQRVKLIMILHHLSWKKSSPLCYFVVYSSPTYISRYITECV